MNTLDRFFAVVFVLGLIMLAVIYGAASQHYSLPFSQAMNNGFTAAETWYREWQTPRAEVPENIKDDNVRRNLFIVTHPNVKWDKEHAFNGYTLISTGYLGVPFLVDMEGKIVYKWQIPYGQIWDTSICTNPLPKAFIFADGAYLYPNGDLLVNYGDSIVAAPYGCGIAKVDKNAHILWSYKAHTHHDFTVDADNNVYVIARKSVTRAPVRGLEGLYYPQGADFITKLSPEGKEIYSISLLEAFHDTPFELMLFHAQDNGYEISDTFHTNSVDVLPAELAAKFPMFKPGQILISIRAMNAIAVLDPGTRKIVWAYRGFWNYQHEARFLPNGHIMVLDNHGHVEYQRTFSRVIEFDPATLEVTWSFAGGRGKPFYVDMAGRLQRLPNGNTLIANSTDSHLFEITDKGDIVWSYALQKTKRSTPGADSIFTARRYSPSQLPFLHE